MEHKRFRWAMALVLIALLLSSLAALCAGQFSISPRQVLCLLLRLPESSAYPKNLSTVLFRIRLPRIGMAILSGAGLACSGAAFQSLFGNPLATPDTLGVANGASFGAALAILLGGGALAVQLSALGMGLMAVVLVFVLTQGRGGERPSLLMLILTGLVLNSLFSALVSLIKYVADPQDVLPVITYWLLGSFSSVTQKSFLLSLPCILIGCLTLFLLRFRLNALSLPEDEARSMGLNLPLLRTGVILCASLPCAAVVASCGVIGWVGLLIPHIARMLFGSDNRQVIPSCTLLGALFLLLMDTLARCISAAEVPVSILTAILGAPLFLILLKRTGGKGA